MGYGVVPMPLTRSHVKLSQAEPAGDQGVAGCKVPGPIRPLHSSRAADPLCTSDSFPLDCWSFSYSFLGDLDVFQRPCRLLSKDSCLHSLPSSSSWLAGDQQDVGSPGRQPPRSTLGAPSPHLGVTPASR